MIFPVIVKKMKFPVTVISLYMLSYAYSLWRCNAQTSALLMIQWSSNCFLSRLHEHYFVIRGTVVLLMMWLMLLGWWTVL